MSSPVAPASEPSESEPSESELSEIGSNEAETVESTETGPSDLPLDQVFDVLRNERRRLVLRYLQEREGPHTIGELAEHIAAHENDKPVAQLSSDERKRAYVGLYQCHLPKMDAMEIVRFNKDRGRVELGANHSLVEPYLDFDDAAPAASEDHWPRRYLSLSAVATVAVALSAASDQGTTWLVAALVVVTFTVASGYHWWLDAAAADDSELPVRRSLTRLLRRSDAESPAD